MNNTDRGNRCKKSPEELIRKKVEGSTQASEKPFTDQLTPPPRNGQRKRIVEFHSQPAKNIDEGYAEALSDADRHREKTKSKDTDKNEGKDKSRKIKHPFEILGFNESDQVLLWRQGSLLRKGVEEVRRTGFVRLHYGPKYNDLKADDIGRSILYEAHKKGVVSECQPYRIGVWKLDDGGFFIVSGKQCLEIPVDGRAKLHKGPVFQGRIVIHERKGWVDLGEVEKIYNDLRPGEGDRHAKREIVRDFERLREHFGQWSWGNDPKDREVMLDHMLSWLFLAPFQHAMRWRPAFYLTGGSSSGKSSFLEQIVSLYSELVCSMAHTTAYAVSQSVGSTSKLLLLDEFEVVGAGGEKRNSQIRQILERVKVMGSGGIHSSGTTEKTPREFALHHLPILASINLPIAIRNDEALRNRFVVFEISKEKGRGGLVGLSEKEVKNLVPNMIGCMALLWPEIERRAEEMRNNSSKIIAEYAKMKPAMLLEQRTVDNFSYLTAFYKYIIRSGDACLLPVPKWVASEERETDEEIFIDTLLTATARHFDGQRSMDTTIEELIRTRESSFSKATLAGLGLSTINRSDGGTYLGIYPKSLEEKVLKNTALGGRDIKSTLRRIKGVIQGKHAKMRLGNRTVYGHLIPMQMLGLDGP